MAMRFAGFNGRPVAEGAGIKAALTFDRESRQYGVIRPGQLDSRWSEDEMMENEKRSLVSLFSTNIPYEGDAVALYAHMRFVVPVAPGLLSLKRELVNELELYPELQAYVTFVSPSRSQEIMQRWATFLLQAARMALSNPLMSREERGRTGFLEAMRARTASPPSSGRRCDRLEAFALAWVGLSLQRKSPDALLRDAARDGLDAETAQQGTKILLTLTPTAQYLPRSYRDDMNAPYRQQEDAA